MYRRRVIRGALKYGGRVIGYGWNKIKKVGSWIRDNVSVSAELRVRIDIGRRRARRRRARRRRNLEEIP